MSYTSINRVVLIGRLTRDPELRALPSGASVCSLRVACNGTRKEPDGEYREKPGYFNVNVFGARGESVQRFMRRGRLIAIDGRLDWREWDTPEGGKRQTVDILANNVQFLDGRGLGDSDSGGAGDDGSDADSSQRADERPLAGVGSSIEDDVVF
jgi:single-strand DNA-binding protein